MANHTLGLWTAKEIAEGHWGVFTVASERLPLAVLNHARDGHDGYRTITTPANARLMAASPELLAVCMRAKKMLEPELTKEPDRTIFWELVFAIAKATGVQA